MLVFPIIKIFCALRQLIIDAILIEFRWLNSYLKPHF